MQQKTFPWLAAGIGLILALVLLRAGSVERSEPLLPPLMLLFISELGFFVTLLGAWSSARLWLAAREQWMLLLIGGACVVMSLAFLYLGIVFWSGLVPVPAS
jgi:hypothetical protein